MARPQVAKERKNALREYLKSNKGKVLTPKQVHSTVGAAYWRALLKDLKAEGMNIESVRKGRDVVGYRLLDGKAESKPVVATTTKKAKATVTAIKK